MPTYDYYCQACDRTFEVHLSLHEHDAHQVQCPSATAFRCSKPSRILKR
jgi:putative FmdB family regulatory protein